LESIALNHIDFELEPIVTMVTESLWLRLLDDLDDRGQPFFGDMLQFFCEINFVIELHISFNIAFKVIVFLR
jgi:hypothetical protein